MGTRQHNLTALTLVAASAVLPVSCTAPYQSEPSPASSASPSVESSSPSQSVAPSGASSTNDLAAQDSTEAPFHNGIGHVFLPKHIEVPVHGPPRVVFDKHKTRIDAHAYRNLDTGGRIDTFIPVYEIESDGTRRTAILSTLTERKPQAIRPVMLKLLDNGTYSLVVDGPGEPPADRLPDHNLYVQYRRDVMIHTSRHNGYFIDGEKK